MFGDLDTLTIVLLFIVCFVLGGGVTIGGVRFDSPIAFWIKKRMGVHEDAGKDANSNVLEKITGLQSYHANTIVLAVKRSGELTDAELQGVSSKANEFFGKAALARELFGMKAGELLPLLKAWMDKDKFEVLAKDQVRLFKEYVGGNVVYAQVPVIFNDKHPHHQYRNRAFLPVIVSLSKEREKGIFGEKEQTLQIVYLDLEPIVPVVEKYTSAA